MWGAGKSGDHIANCIDIMARPHEMHLCSSVFDDPRNHGESLGVIGVQQVRTDMARDDRGEFPSEIYRILQPAD